MGEERKDQVIRRPCAPLSSRPIIVGRLYPGHAKGNPTPSCAL